MIFERYSDNHMCGVSLETSVADMMCTFTLAKRKQTLDSTTDGFCKFSTKKTSALVWDCLNKEGRLIPGEIPIDPKITGKQIKNYLSILFIDLACVIQTTVLRSQHSKIWIKIYVESSLKNKMWDFFFMADFYLTFIAVLFYDIIVRFSQCFYDIFNGCSYLLATKIYEKIKSIFTVVENRILYG